MLGVCMFQVSPRPVWQRGQTVLAKYWEDDQVCHLFFCGFFFFLFFFSLGFLFTIFCWFSSLFQVMMKNEKKKGKHLQSSYKLDMSVLRALVFKKANYTSCFFFFLSFFCCEQLGK